MTQMAATDSPLATILNANTADTASTDQNQIVRNTAALGWALTELLSRCFSLEQLGDDEKKALKQVWTGGILQILPPIRTPRQQIYAVFYSIRSLAKQLDLNKPIDENAIPSLAEYLNPGKPVDDALKAQLKGKNYIGVIGEKIRILCDKDFDPEKSTEIRGQINGLLQYWDTVIYDKLQEKSTDPNKAYAYLNAYLVGRSLAALRWHWYGSPKPVQAQILDKGSLQRLCQHVQLMAPSLPKFAAVALAHSVEQWGTALLQPKVSGEASRKVQEQTKQEQAKQEQAVIWHDLLTGSRDPITYVEPSRMGLRYTLKVLFFLWPYIVLGIVSVVVIVGIFLFLLGFLWPLIFNAVTNNKLLASIIATIGTGFALLTGIGAAIPPIGVIWKWLTGKVQSEVDQSAGAAISSAQSSLISMLWDAAQQEEVNNATYIRVP